MKTQEKEEPVVLGEVDLNRPKQQKKESSKKEQE